MKTEQIIPAIAKRTLLLALAIGIMCSLLYLVDISTESVQAMAGDRVNVSCEKTGSHYKARIDYSAKSTRLILMAVHFKKGGGRRVYRHTVKAGSGTLTWDAKLSRFPPLTKACVAMHKTTGDRRTIASDCSPF